jgi:predicted SprT family Zn-dependent metalloprotease
MVSVKFSKVRLALICHLHEYGSGMRVRHHFRESAALCRPVSQFID